MKRLSILLIIISLCGCEEKPSPTLSNPECLKVQVENISIEVGDSYLKVKKELEKLGAVCLKSNLAPGQSHDKYGNVAIEIGRTASMKCWKLPDNRRLLIYYELDYNLFAPKKSFEEAMQSAIITKLTLKINQKR